MRNTSVAGRATGLAVFALAALCAFAASADGGPGPIAGAGGVMRDAERRVLSPVVPAAGKNAPELPAPGRAESAGRDSGRKIGYVESIQINGSAEFAAREGVADMIMEALGGPGDRTDAEVSAALAAVRQKLMERGFYLVRIFQPRYGAYDAAERKLSILVDEGRFGRLTLRFGEKDDGFWYSRDQILSRFKGIDEGDTFDYGRLRGALFDANSHPDLTIDTSISVRKPIEGEGADRRIARYADLDLDVRESFPFHLVWEVNNYGMEEIEEWQTSLTVQYLNLTKHDDVLTVSPSMSFGGELFSLAGSYMLPHHWWRGGATTLYGGYSDLDVDDIVPRLDLEGSGYFVGLQHTENLYDDDSHLLALSVGILWRYIEDQYTAYSSRLQKRSATILPISAALSYTGKRPDFLGGRNFATVQGVYNLVNGDDKLDEMWTDAEENYWLFRWQLARLQPLFGWFDPRSELDLHQWMLFMKIEGQYTSDTLIPVEKLSLGGYNCLRGYHARGYMGDYGVYGTVELRTPILVDAFASLFGDRTDKNAVDRLQFLGFVDWGWTAFNDLPSGYDDNEWLYSAGFGARLSVTKYTQLKCDVAFPLHDTDWADDDSVEVYFSMQVQF
jgi:hemolysin activation/secretion protein